MPVMEMLTRLLSVLLIVVAFTGVVLAGIWALGRPDKSLHGIWVTEGYGLVVDITPFTLRIHELSPVSCLPWQSMPAHMGAIRGLAGYEFTANGDEMRVQVADIANDIKAKRVDALPQQCLEGRPAGPIETFDIFWQTFAQHYPNFDLYGVDWDARRATALSEIGDNLDPKHLAGVMERSLAGLRDGHVNLVTPSGQFSPQSTASWVPDQRAIWAVTDARLDDPQVITSADIRHGWLDDGIAYLRLHHMEPAQSMGKQMDDAARKVVAELSDTYAQAKGIVVDMRYNDGGSDVVALIYAGLFSDTDWDAATKRSQLQQNVFSDETALRGFGSSAPISAPVVVLNSAETVSAGEIFLMAVRELPQVTLMGEASAGALSDMMLRSLPNGWQFSLPHQVYLAANGEAYEGQGIPVDIPYPFDAEGFSAGEDTMLDAAIEHLASQK